MARIGGDLHGIDAMEIGCGRGYGTELLLDVLRARSVAALDIDPAMVRLAARRLRNRAVVRVADMLDTGAAPNAYGAVVDMGAIHIEPRWRQVLVEVRRVLSPGGRFYFEEIVRPARQAVTSIAVGKRLRSDFAKGPFLLELDSLGFEIVGIDNSLPPALTGLVGDMIGVAVLSAQ